MSVQLAAIVAVGVLEAALLVWAAGALRRAAQVEARLGQLTDALALLSETTETGFKAAAREMGRLAEVQASLPAAAAEAGRGPTVRSDAARATSPKPRRPARKPRIASDDVRPSAAGLASRTEERLRLHMAEHTPPARAAEGRGGDRGSLRA